MESVSDQKMFYILQRILVLQYYDIKDRNTDRIFISNRAQNGKSCRIQHWQMLIVESQLHIYKL